MNRRQFERGDRVLWVQYKNKPFRGTVLGQPPPGSGLFEIPHIYVRFDKVHADEIGVSDACHWGAYEEFELISPLQLLAEET